MDAVEIIMAVEETFGIAISDADAAEMITPAMLISHVQNLVGSEAREGACLSQRAFHQIRSDLMKVTGAKRSEISLNTPVRDLFPKLGRNEKWKEFCQLAKLENLSGPGFLRAYLFWLNRVKDLVRVKVDRQADFLKEQGRWTDQEVRELIRKIIADYTDGSRFSDDDEFVRDLGLD